MKRNHSAVLLGFVVGSTLALTGCSSAVDHTVAGSIKSALPSAIGPAENYAVTVKTDPIALAQGHLREVDIVGTDVQLSPQLLIDELDIDASDIDINLNTRQVKSVGQVLFLAQVGQDNIDHYIDNEPAGSTQRAEDLKVTVNDHSITARVLVKMLGIDVPASVTGAFEVEPDNPKLLDFVANKGSLSIIPLPQFALNIALQRINPVIDLSDTNVPVTVDQVTIQSGKIIISGEADLQNGLVKSN